MTASSKETLCFARLTAAFRGSHSILSVSDNYPSANFESLIHAHNVALTGARLPMRDQRAMLPARPG